MIKNNNNKNFLEYYESLLAPITWEKQVYISLLGTYKKEKRNNVEHIEKHKKNKTGSADIQC